jgi:hypothetical protein
MLIATLFVLANVNLPDMASAVVNQLGEAGVNPSANPRFGWTFIFWMLIGSVAMSALNRRREKVCPVFRRRKSSVYRHRWLGDTWFRCSGDRRVGNVQLR